MQRQLQVAATEGESEGICFKRLFQASPSPLLILNPDTPRFTIAEVNDAYLAASMRRREELVGRGIFEAFPDDPREPGTGGVNLLRSSLDRVLATRQPDVLTGLRHHMALPDGTFEERWWNLVNSVVLGENGEVQAIIHNANDVTEQFHTEAGLRRSEERLELALQATDLAVYEWDLASDRVTTNERFRRWSIEFCADRGRSEYCTWSLTSSPA